MAESQEINTLRRRGRRRLVGAIALVLLAVIVLPMVFDSEPKQSSPPVSVRIPSEDDAGFAPKVTPKPPPAASTPHPAAAPPSEPAKPEPETKAETRPEEKHSPKAADKGSGADAERDRAVAAMAGEEFVVPVAALANAAKVEELTARLAEAKLPYYTEPIATRKGPVTRVRVGPFADRATAEKALEQLKLLGLKPGSIISKS